MAHEVVGPPYPTKATNLKWHETKRDDELSTDHSDSLRCADGVMASTVTNSSAFVPKESVVHVQIRAFTRSFPMMSRSHIKYHSIHARKDKFISEPKGYVQHLHGRGGEYAFVLLDEHQEPILLCRRDNNQNHRTQQGSAMSFTFNGRYSLLTDEAQDDLHAVIHDGSTFFPWLRVTATRVNGKAQILFRVWNQGSFREATSLSETSVKTEREIDVSNLHGFLLRSMGTFSTANDDGEQGTVVSANNHHRRFRYPAKQHRWNISVNPGDDPAMMICLTVAFENFMV